MVSIHFFRVVYRNLTVRPDNYNINQISEHFSEYIRTIRLLRIRMKRRRNALDHIKKLNKNPNWLWKREIQYNATN